MLQRPLLLQLLPATESALAKAEEERSHHKMAVKKSATRCSFTLEVELRLAPRCCFYGAPTVASGQIQDQIVRRTVVGKPLALQIAFAVFAAILLRGWLLPFPKVLPRVRKWLCRQMVYFSVFRVLFQRISATFDSACCCCWTTLTFGSLQRRQKESRQLLAEFKRSLKMKMFLGLARTI